MQVTTRLPADVYLKAVREAEKAKLTLSEWLAAAVARDLTKTTKKERV